MLAEMYSISKGQKASLKNDVNAAIESFYEKYGYKPKVIIVQAWQADEAKGFEVEVQIDKVQPGHFMLGPIKEKYGSHL